MTDTEATPEPTAELTPLQQIEHDNGFTFGTPDTYDDDKQPTTAALVCTNPTCPNRSQHIEINTDTLLPVRCGGCATVLACNHDTVTTVTTEGTLANPVEITTDTCIHCTTITRTDRRNLPAIDITDLPVATLAQLLGGSPS